MLSRRLCESGRQQSIDGGTKDNQHDVELDV